MSSITGLISGGGGGGTPVNGIERLYLGGQTQYTDESGGVWLKTGVVQATNSTVYPNAIESSASNWSGTQPIASSMTSTNFTFQTLDGGVINNSQSSILIACAADNRVYECTITDGNLSTYVYTRLIGISIQPVSLVFSEDNTKLYVIGSTNLVQYNLSTPGSLINVSATPYSNINLTTLVPGIVNCAGVSLKKDGTKIYVSSGQVGIIYEFDLSTPFDLSTISYNNVFFDPKPQISNALVGWHAFGLSGKTLAVAATNNYFYKFTLTNAYDLSTATYTNDVITNLAGTNVGANIYNGTICKGSNRANYRYNFNFEDFLGISQGTGTYDYIKLK